MKRNLSLLTIIMMFVAANVYAQPNIFNQNDPIVEYTGSNMPAIPPANTMAKWIKNSTRIGWNTSKFKCYYWNGMAFRLRFPNNYNPADNTKKYPVILFFHGAGEIKPITDNEDQLYWGAQPFEARINGGQFNAFMLFPQVSVASAWDFSYYTRVNSVLDSMQKYCNTDPDKLIVMGLSNGGYAALNYAGGNPQRVSTVIGASPSLLEIILNLQKNSFHIPTWLASGGQDISPAPDVMNLYVDSFRAKGGDIRYSFFPELGHGVWEEQWQEPYLVPYWVNAHKANPLLYYQTTQYCPTAVTAKLGLTAGFAEYQWQVNSTDIPNSNKNEIVAPQLGTYRARFRRIAGGPWSEWSMNPVTITALPPTASPAIKVSGVRSLLLPAPDGSTTTPLEMPLGFNTYEWRRVNDNALVSTQRIYNAPVGQYKAIATNCSSTYSPVFTVLSANGSPKPDSARNLTLSRLTTRSIKLTWTEVANPVSNETGFEVYRAAKAGGPYTLVNITAANVKTYTDTLLNDNYNYYYTIRAINGTGASGLSNEATLQPLSDIVVPTAPTNLKAIFTSRGYIDLEWTASTDNVGVVAYDIYQNSVKKYTSVVPSYRADTVLPNASYNFTVIARDQAGNSSTVSNTANATSTLNGLKYHYYQGNWDLLPNFSTLTPVTSGTSLNVNIADRPAGISDNFAFVWEGLINIRIPGTYTFETVSDDGSKLYFDQFYSPGATALVNNDGPHGAISATGTVTITDTGLHPIAITYFEKNSGESMQVYWTGPGLNRQLIPNSAFNQTVIASTDNVPPSAPANLKSVYTGRDYVELDWDNSTDNVGVIAYDIYVNNAFAGTSPTSSFIVDSLIPKAQYNFTVKARDFTGNVSAASAVLNITTGATSLRYKYYEGNWDVLPNFNTLTPVKTGSSANVDIAVRPATVNDLFAFVWEGYINIKTPGNYTFETISDDGSKLYFDTFYSPGAPALVDNDGVHGAISETGTITVTDTGMHKIAITYFEKGNGQSVQVYWTGPGIVRQLIPNAAFTESYQAPVDNVVPTAPTGLKANFLGNTSIDLSWNAATDNVGVVAYDVYIGAASTPKYTTTGLSISADTLLPNTTYTFTVKARDAGGNRSVASNSISAKTTTAAAGLKYKFYQGDWDVLPNFNTLTPVKTGISANPDITTRTTGVNDLFGYVWEGYINIPAAGTYTFETMSDDGSKLYFNSQYSPTATALVNNDGLHGAISATGVVTVPTAGYYPIAITFFEKTSGESIQVFWTSSTIARQVIPSSAFVYELPADNTAPTAPTGLASALTNSTFVNLTWNASTDNVGVTGYNVYKNSNFDSYVTTTSATVDSLTPGAQYIFTVKAVDFAGNLSTVSNSLTLNTTSTTSGLTYKYYHGAWDVLPNFSLLTPVKTGSSTNVDITPRTQNDNFAFVWEGKIVLPTAGTYTFETVSDDGSKLYFNSLYSPSAVATVNNDGLHGAISATGSVAVAAPGAYPIAITFFERGSGESMQVYWTGPGIPRQLIPNSAFNGTFVPPTDNIVPSTPTNLKALLTTNTYVDIAWDASTDNIAVTGYDIYVGGVFKTTVTGTNYRLTGLSANQSSTFTIKASDLANNKSTTSAALVVVAAPKAQGLKYRYYEGNWDALPNFDTVAVVKTGSSTTTDLSVRRSGVNDYYGFVWEGYIKIVTPGNYTFETVSDDGSRFYFNTLYNPAATPLVNNDGLHGAISATGVVNIPTAGLYPISITFFEKNSGESMQVYYTGPGIVRQLIPATSFSVADDAPEQAGPTTTEASNLVISVSGNEPDVAIDANISRAYPNPFKENLKIQYSGTTSANNITVGIYDMNGRVVQRQNFGSRSAGVNTFSVNLDKQMVPGVYLVRLDVNGKPMKLWKMIKQKK